MNPSVLILMSRQPGSIRARRTLINLYAIAINPADLHHDMAMVQELFHVDRYG
jgi:hypothetical protein